MLTVVTNVEDAPAGPVAAGAVAVRAPRVNDKRVDETSAERRQFSSAIRQVRQSDRGLTETAA